VFKQKCILLQKGKLIAEALGYILGVTSAYACLAGKRKPKRSYYLRRPISLLCVWCSSLTESRAICRYICDQYADSGNQALFGKKEDGAVGRAAIEQWIESEGQSFNPPSLAIIFQLAFAPMMGRTTDLAVVEQNEAKLAKVLDVYDQRLGESQYFAGDDFSLADLVHLPNADFLVNRTSKAGLITERKNLARWWDDVSSRPAWKKVTEMQSAPRPS
jgi:glutathione S-transferase